MENKVIFTLCAFLVLTLLYPVIGQDNAPEPSSDPPNPAMDLASEEATPNTSTNNSNTDTAVEDPTVVPSVKQLSTPALLATFKESGTPGTSMEVPTFVNPTNLQLNLTDEIPPSALQPLDNQTLATHEPLPTPTGPIDRPQTTGHTHVSTVSSHIPPQSTQPNISQSHTTHHPKKADSDSTTAIPNPTDEAYESLPETTTTSFSTTSASQPSSASSPSQPNEDQSIKPFASPSPESTVSPELQPQTSSPAQHQSTSTQPSITSAQAKVRAETPSRLNVGGDATAVHEATSLDPLLAALVSAFVVAAAIVTLLVFLKLQRRGNQPEFRRLQDLPMDDMMEDAPLSMHTY